MKMLKKITTEEAQMTACGTNLPWEVVRSKVCLLQLS
jgi:hypothetical protein